MPKIEAYSAGAEAAPYRVTPVSKSEAPYLTEPFSDTATLEDMLPMQHTHITMAKPAIASIPPGEFDWVLSRTKLTSVSGSCASWSL